MFGEKARVIEDLREKLRDTELWYDAQKSNCKSALDRLAQKQTELSIIQEAFRNGVVITDNLKEQLAASERELKDSDEYFDARIGTLEFALNESKGLNQALEDENRDLVRQVELLQAVLGQLSVQVKIPARKR